MSQTDHVRVGPDERALTKAAQALYEGSDRYRPGTDRRTYGLSYTLTTRTGPVQRTIWLSARAQAGARMAEARAGMGWLGQQVMQGTCQEMRIVQRSTVHGAVRQGRPRTPPPGPGLARRVPSP